MLIAFYYKEKIDSLIVEKVVTGYVKKVVDSLNYEVLPIQIFEEKHINGKIVDTRVQKFNNENSIKIENINFVKFQIIAYESKTNKIVFITLKGIALTTAIIVYVSIPFLKDAKVTTETVANVDVSFPKSFLLISGNFLLLKQLFKPTKYKVYKCETCNPKTNYYSLKQYTGKK